MKIGTKTLLFGGHQFLIHPFLVGLAWIKIYHKLPNPKETICIFIHDWGYWGKPNIDGKEGDEHPIWASMWASNHLDNPHSTNVTRYARLCLYHSRFTARKLGHQPSKLCAADKVGVTFYPAWLWYILVKLSGELDEYINSPKYAAEREFKEKNPREWFRRFKRAVPEWIKSGAINNRIDTV